MVWESNYLSYGYFSIELWIDNSGTDWMTYSVSTLTPGFGFSIVFKYYSLSKFSTFLTNIWIDTLPGNTVLKEKYPLIYSTSI